MTENQKSIGVARMVAAMVGLGSYWAWMNLSAANATVFPWLVESLYPPQLLISSCFYLAGMAAMFIFGERPWMRDHRHGVTLLATGIAVAGSCSTVLGTVVGAPSGALAFAVVGFATSFGTAMLLVLWGAFCCRQGPREAALMTTGSFAFGTLAYLVLSEYFAGQLLWLLPALLLAYGAFLLLLEGSRESRETTTRLDGATGALTSRGIVAVLGCLGLCIILNEVLRLISTPLAADDFSRVGLLTQFGGFLISTASFLAVLLSRRPFGFNTMAVVLVPLMIAGFLSFLVFADSDSSLVFILLGAGYWCLNMLVWVALCNVVRRTRTSAVRGFALFYGIIQVAILVAKPVGDWVANHLSVTSSGLSLLISISVIAIVVIAMLLLRNRSMVALLDEAGAEQRDETPSDEDKSFANSSLTTEVLSTEGSDSAGAKDTDDRLNPDWLTALAERYGLTPRETEVFLLLARGRSLPVICDELSIALGTTQTHVRHIYEKLAIHTRQELFDIVEGEWSSRQNLS
ncbi:helix-turn-helix transcriptional regulator [Adlercreutzia equolifaciens]|uniref:response regulator transcription factor n=1 Tax=Adlercreutzia equolifaciens TaxID=446660 RepID=UPI0023B15EE4|nr:helix-turn-helix transcriptional regulator [Adlercreutzia equolifaciens]MDE8702732.1 helix-turn-helix transcriptional regulator [Adlercreutzia equolifaciens]